MGIGHPIGLTNGPDGALWFTNYANKSIGRITVDGSVTNVMGPGINGAVAITTGPDGSLWFANRDNQSIGRITPA